jgi:predicted lipoprotein
MKGFTRASSVDLLQTSSMPTPKSVLMTAMVFVAMTNLAGCKILPTPTEEDKAAAAAEAFNPDRMVEEMWEPKVLPYLKGKAGPFQEVSKLAASDAKAAGEKYGNPKKQANSPWTYVASAEGKIVASNTQSRAATIDVDVDGDSKADLRAQIGPALRGTALRDALDFVDFNSFKNQIDFAQFGKSFNTYANTTVLSKLPREQLDGRTAKLLGAYVPGSGSDLPLMTPARAEFGPAP